MYLYSVGSNYLFTKAMRIQQKKNATVSLEIVQLHVLFTVYICKAANIKELLQQLNKVGRSMQRPNINKALLELLAMGLVQIVSERPGGFGKIVKTYGITLTGEKYLQDLEKVLRRVRPDY